ncbi:response regulator transcription factor [Acidovorax sp. A79]
MPTITGSRLRAIVGRRFAGTDTPHSVATMKIILADDHTLFREGLQHLLSALDPQAQVLEANDYASAALLVVEHPDAALALVDLDMPGRDASAPGGGGLERLLALAPGVPVVVLSAREDPAVVRDVLDAGAMGFISKRERAAVMLNALHLVLAGGIYLPPMLLGTAARASACAALTPRQVEVLHGLANGHANKVIARQLGMSEATVKAHTGAIFRSLEVSNRVQAVRMARRLGLLAPD